MTRIDMAALMPLNAGQRIVVVAYHIEQTAIDVDWPTGQRKGVDRCLIDHFKGIRYIAPIRHVRQQTPADAAHALRARRGGVYPILLLDLARTFLAQVNLLCSGEETAGPAAA